MRLRMMMSYSDKVSWATGVYMSRLFSFRFRLHHDRIASATILLPNNYFFRFLPTVLLDGLHLNAPSIAVPGLLPGVCPISGRIAPAYSSVNRANLCAFLTCRLYSFLTVKKQPILQLSYSRETINDAL